MLNIFQHLLQLAGSLIIRGLPGVDDLNLEHSFPVVVTHDNLNSLIRCEFERVFNQIDQYLLQSDLVTHENLR